MVLYSIFQVFWHSSYRYDILRTILYIKKPCKEQPSREFELLSVSTSFPDDMALARYISDKFLNLLKYIFPQIYYSLLLQLLLF